MKFSNVKAYKYKLEENFVQRTGIVGFNFDNRYYSMLDDGTFLAKYSYTWDGSSIPYKRLLRFLSLRFYDADRYCKEASLIHDGLCQAMREGLLPAKYKILADLLYQQMCIEYRMKMWEIKTKNKTRWKRKEYTNKTNNWAAKRYWALRKFGDIGIQPEQSPRNTTYDTEKG